MIKILTIFILISLSNMVTVRCKENTRKRIYHSCKIFGDRVLCGYQKNKNRLKLSFVYITTKKPRFKKGCFVNGNRMECGYDNSQSRLIQKVMTTDRAKRLKKYTKLSSHHTGDSTFTMTTEIISSANPTMKTHTRKKLLPLHISNNLKSRINYTKRMLSPITAKFPYPLNFTKRILSPVAVKYTYATNNTFKYTKRKLSPVTPRYRIPTAREILNENKTVLLSQKNRKKLQPLKKKSSHISDTRTATNEIKIQATEVSTKPISKAPSSLQQLPAICNCTPVVGCHCPPLGGGKQINPPRAPSVCTTASECETPYLAGFPFLNL